MKFFLLVFFSTLLFYPKLAFGQPPDLGASSTFALFTAVGAFNGDPATSVIGDIGTDMGAFTPVGFHIGQVHVSDAVSAQAAADVMDAYADLAGRICGMNIGVTLGGGQILTPDTYCTGAATTLDGDLVLDAEGDPDAIFIFQFDGAFASSVNSTVTLINGASLCNVFWQINGQVDLGENSVFQGTIIAEGAINLLAEARLVGRGLSTAGAISTNANVVTLPAACFCVLTVVCPAAIGGTYQCIDDIPIGQAADVTVESACGVATVVISETSSGTGCAASPFILIRTYTVTDEEGNTTDCIVTYTTIDDTAPTIECPIDVTISCLDLVPLDASLDIVTTDNCGGVVTVVLESDVITGQTCPNNFSILRTYVATDDCGNSTSCVQSILVSDLVPPTIECPIDVTISCLNLVPLDASLDIVTSDNCGGV
ncbi:MAG: ice-binding family protein, partial [Saprospiraceae bacterium]|nr:ice-binding family protein [Saprospiraceae bacterium]